MYGYSVESFKQWDDKPILVNWQRNAFPQRYDYRQKKWIKDQSLCRINIGELFVDEITKEQADEIIKMNS